MNTLLMRLATDISPGQLPQPGNVGDGALQGILTVVFGIVGGLAVLMVIISGLRYIIAGDDANKISQAKDGLIYALVGVAVAVAAEAIVAFVGNRL